MTGLIEPARRVPSPNKDERPEGQEPRLVVLHGISLPPGQFGGSEIEQLFRNQLDWDAHPYFDEIRGLQVSAHLLVRRDGELVQFVPFTERAWHAGASSFRQQHRCNDYSIGIELEGEDETPYENAQYDTLAAVVADVDRWHTRRFHLATLQPTPISRRAERQTRVLLSTGSVCIMGWTSRLPEADI